MRKRRKKSSNKSLGILVIILIIVIAGVGGYFACNKIMNNSATVDVEEDTKKVKKNTEDNEGVTEEEQKEEQTKEKPSEYEAVTQTGEKVKVEANKMVTATGFSGASNYKFYLRGTTLYFRNTSVSSNEEDILAYNVKDLYLENREVIAELYSDGKIVKENNYITYK